jgi:hypothetical protein
MKKPSKNRVKKTEEIAPENLVTVHRDIPSIYDGKRIYVVVADTVQTHLDTTGLIGCDNKWPPKQTIRRSELTKTVEQPAGRLIAQAAHVVSKVRHNMLKEEVVRAQRIAYKNKSNEMWMQFQKLFFQPVTTIVLSARDSFELYHVKNLLKNANIPYQTFFDENDPVYGEGEKVMTAVATEPVDPLDVQGILDYLHLWKPTKLYTNFQAQNADEL